MKTFQVDMTPKTAGTGMTLRYIVEARDSADAEARVCAMYNRHYSYQSYFVYFQCHDIAVTELVAVT